MKQGEWACAQSMCGWRCEILSGDEDQLEGDCRWRWRQCREMGRGPQKLKNHVAQVLNVDPPPS